MKRLRKLKNKVSSKVTGKASGKLLHAAQCGEPMARRTGRRRALLAGLGLSFVLPRHSAATQPAPAVKPLRPERWAAHLPKHGVKNLHQIAPTLYRSAQPRSSDVPALRKLGIRTVVSLRSFNDDEKVFRRSDIRLVRIPINTWNINDAQVTEALRAIRQAQKDGPVLLHCLHGADRTGVISALYRMTEQGWSKDEARTEMLEGGYGYHTLWRNIPAYLRKVDPVAIRAALDAPATAPASAPSPAKTPAPTPAGER